MSAPCPSRHTSESVGENFDTHEDHPDSQSQDRGSSVGDGELDGDQQRLPDVGDAVALIVRRWGDPLAAEIESR